MPEEKVDMGVLKEGKNATEESVRDIWGVPEVEPAARDEKKSEGNAEGSDARFVSSYERKLHEFQQAKIVAIPPPSKQTDDNTIRFDANSIVHMDDAEGRVQKLLDLALLKGVVHAVRVAKHIDAYTLDRTHDRLADELSDRLREQGLLKGSE